MRVRKQNNAVVVVKCSSGKCGNRRGVTFAGQHDSGQTRFDFTAGWERLAVLLEERFVRGAKSCDNYEASATIRLKELRVGGRYFDYETSAFLVTCRRAREGTSKCTRMHGSLAGTVCLSQSRLNLITCRTTSDVYFVYMYTRNRITSRRSWEAL